VIAVTRSRTVGGDLTRVWDVLADFGAISTWASNVDHSCLLVDPGVGDDLDGVTRRIQTGRTVLVERIVDWSPPARLAYRIEGLPPVLRSVVNEWRLVPNPTAPARRTSVTLISHVDAGPRPPQQVIARVVGRRLAAASDEMLDGLAADLAAATTKEPRS